MKITAQPQPAEPLNSALFSDCLPPPTLDHFHRATVAQIPILQAMGITFSDFTQSELRVDMPLAANINDKNTCFGGSIVTLATITGWGLLSLLLNREQKHFDVIIAESSTRYIAPVTSDCYARTRLNPEQASTLSQSLYEFGKGRITLHVEVCLEDQTVATYEGLYVVRRKNIN